MRSVFYINWTYVYMSLEFLSNMWIWTVFQYAKGKGLAHTLKSGFSLNPNKSTSYYGFVSQWMFALRPQSLSFIRSWSQASWVLAGLKVPGESWRTGGKSSGKNVLRNPLHSLPENLLNIWPVPTVFIGLIIGTEKIKDRRTPTGLCNSYWGPADGAFGTYQRVASPASLSCSHCHLSVRGGSRKQ